MDRLAMLYRIREGKKDEYIRAHREIWPEMLSLLRRAGIQEMRIYNRGDQLLVIATMESIKSWQQAQVSDPVYARWDSYMENLLDKPYDQDEPGIFASMEEIWHFDILE